MICWLPLLLSDLCFASSRVCILCDLKLKKKNHLMGGGGGGDFLTSRETAFSFPVLNVSCSSIYRSAC